MPSPSSVRTSSSAMSRDRALHALALLVLYPWLKSALLPWLEGIWPYAGYLFELAFVAIGLAALRTGILPSEKVSDWLAPFAIGPSVIALGLGFAAHLVAVKTGLPIPFDLSTGDTIFLLLVVAPFLEEAIFRGVLWDALHVFTRDVRVTFGVTTLLFALAHFEAYGRVPSEIRPFVLYQTVYVTALSALSALARMKSGSLFVSVLVHLTFNLGFYFSSLIFAPAV